LHYSLAAWSNVTLQFLRGGCRSTRRHPLILLVKRHSRGATDLRQAVHIPQFGQDCGLFSMRSKKIPRRDAGGVGGCDPRT